MKRQSLLILVVAGLTAWVSLPLVDVQAINSVRRAARNLPPRTQAQTYTFTKIADNAGQFRQFDPHPSISDNGTVAFEAGLNPSGFAVVKGNGGTLTTIADTNTNVSPYGLISAFGFGFRPTINTAGLVAFQNQISDPLFRVFVLAGDGGSISVVHTPPSDPQGPCAGTPFITNLGDVFMITNDCFQAGSSGIAVSRAGGALTTLYGNFGVISGYSANQVGKLAFVSGPTPQSQWYVFTGDGGPATQVADPSSTDGQAGFSGALSLNNHGEIALQTREPLSRILVWDGTALRTAVQSSASGPFYGFSQGGPSINDAGDVVFSAVLSPVFGSLPEGIYIGPDPIADKVAAVGDQILGTRVAAVESGKYALNNSGQIAFWAAVEDPNHRMSEVIIRADPVMPNNAPVAICKDAFAQAGPACSAFASIDNGSSDPDGDEITIIQNPPGPYSLGTTIVTLTVTDIHGASSNCTGTVTVVDRNPPVINCPTNVAATADLGASSAIVIFTSPAASDTCGGVRVVCSPPSGSSFPVGTNAVTCSATDGASNQSECSFSVAVLTPQAATQALIGTINLLVNQGTMRGSDASILITELQVARLLMNQGNRQAATQLLRAFISSVNALVRVGRLPAREAQLLVNTAIDLIAHVSS